MAGSLYLLPERSQRNLAILAKKCPFCRPIGLLEGSMSFQSLLESTTIFKEVISFWKESNNNNASLENIKWVKIIERLPNYSKLNFYWKSIMVVVIGKITMNKIMLLITSVLL